MCGNWRRPQLCVGPFILSRKRTTDPTSRMYGITVLQTYIYFRRYTKDRLPLKLLVSNIPLAYLDEVLTDSSQGRIAVVRALR